MRILGLDYGEVRIGVAVSDPLGITALPLSFIENNDRAFSCIIDLIKQYQVGKIVVGNPIKMDGSIGAAAEKARMFSEALKNQIKADVDLWDERLTTKMAQRSYLDLGVSQKRSRKNIDSTSASLMLQGYIDRKNNEKLHN